MKLVISIAFTALTITAAAVALTAHAQTSASKQESKRPFACVEAEVIVNAPLVDAWNAWTTNEGAQQFFAPRTEIELFPGGSYNILFMPDNPAGQRGAEEQKVLSFLPMQMLSFDWGAPPKFPFARQHPGWVVVTFDVVDDQHTRVQLVHLGFDELKAKYPEHAVEFDAVREYFSNAWSYVLNNLKRRFEEGPRFDAQGKDVWKES